MTQSEAYLQKDTSEMKRAMSFVDQMAMKDKWRHGLRDSSAPLTPVKSANKLKNSGSEKIL